MSVSNWIRQNVNQKLVMGTAALVSIVAERSAERSLDAQMPPSDMVQIQETRTLRGAAHQGKRFPLRVRVDGMSAERILEQIDLADKAEFIQSEKNGAVEESAERSQAMLVQIKNNMEQQGVKAVSEAVESAAPGSAGVARQPSGNVMKV